MSGKSKNIKKKKMKYKVLTNQTEKMYPKETQSRTVSIIWRRGSSGEVARQHSYPGEKGK